MRLRTPAYFRIVVPPELARRRARAALVLSLAGWGLLGLLGSLLG